MWKKDTRELPGTHFQIACWRWELGINNKGEKWPWRGKPNKRCPLRIGWPNALKEERKVLLRQGSCWALREVLNLEGWLVWGRQALSLRSHTPTGSVDGSRGDLSLFNGTLFSLPQRQEIFISGAGMNQGSWPYPLRAWQKMERQLQEKVRVDFVKNLFDWSTVVLHCCVTLCCMATWFSYTYTYILFYIFPFQFITGYWV